jgi:hypothetical protein
MNKKEEKKEVLKLTKKQETIRAKEAKKEDECVYRKVGCKLYFFIPCFDIFVK